MPTHHLSDTQRQTYARFNSDPSNDELSRYFHLDQSDFELIRTLRGDDNRLGFALMLGSVRFLGVFSSDLVGIPRSVIVHMARQLGLRSNVLLDNYFSGRQRLRHLALIRERYNITDFATDRTARCRLNRWLFTLCWSGDDRPELLVDRSIEWLIANKVLLPGGTTIERLVGRIRDRARKRLWRKLVDGLTQDQRNRINKLFSDNEPTTFNTLDALRTVPTRRSSSEFNRHLERLDQIRAYDLRPAPPKGVPATVIERLARVARVGRPSAILALQEPRRTATVAALFYTLEASAQDDAAELAEALLIDLMKDAERAERQARYRSLGDLDDAAIFLSGLGKLVLSDDTLPFDQWRDVLFGKLPRAELEVAIAKINELAKPNGSKPYAELIKRWISARRLFFNVVTRIDLNASHNGEAVHQAMAYLKTVKWTGEMRKAPIDAIPKSWRRHVLDADNKVADPKAYVFAIIDAWRGALKRRDIFARPGVRYGDPRHGMLEGVAWKQAQPLACRSLNRSLDAQLELSALTELLDRAYCDVASRVEHNADFRVETVNGAQQIIVPPLDKLEDPASLKLLRRAIQERMPRVGLPDVVLEVMQRVKLAPAFTHLSERQARVDDFETSLSAVLMAKGCNIGFEPMTRPGVSALRKDRLSWVGQNFLRQETIAAANAKIVAAQNAVPVVQLWGNGTIASADGMRFSAPKTAIHAGPNPKYYLKRGITWYNMVSDQFTGLNALVVPGTLRDSLAILALLLDQETELEPIEIMTDTAAYSDAIFGLFWLLGYQFSPRLADIGGAKLWRVDKQADYGVFDEIVKGKINLALPTENWTDLIRLAGSLKLGYLKAAGVMRILQVKEKPTTLAKALSELGRIIKTLHILRYIDDADFRRKILTQLNRQESRHSLGRKLFLGDRGEIRDPLRQDQEETLGTFGLVLNIIAHWNAVYMQETIDQLRREGMVIHDDDIARLSPIIWRHINFLGRYDFALPEIVANGGLRPLRDPNSE